MNLLRMLESHHGIMEMKGYPFGGLDSESLHRARSMLHAQVKVEPGTEMQDPLHNPHLLWNLAYNSAGHHGHSMSTHSQNNNNSTGPPSMANRVQDLACTPTANSFSPPTSIQNSQLVVPHPLKPVKAKKSYQCKMCDQKFDSKSSVYHHGKEAHGLQDKAHPCMHCYKSFSSPSQLHQHSLVHTGERKYHCKFCNKSFKQLSHLQQHTRIHTGEKPYKCTIPNCNKAFAQLSNLQHHQRNHDNNKAKSSRKSFYCTVCQRGFVTESSLDKHITRLHSHLSQHSNAVKAGACAAMAGLPSPHSLQAKLDHHNLISQNHHQHGLLAHSMGLSTHTLACPSPAPRPMTASSMSSLEEHCIDMMAPLRANTETDPSPLSLSMAQRQHHSQVLGMGGTHANLPPISQVSSRCFPLAPGIPAAALAGLRASALSSFNYGTHTMARSPLAGMTGLHRDTSPGHPQN